jgi:DNA repair protein RecO (recombination protein O)
MHWRDDGFILGSRPHGENAAIVDLFTATRGRHAGLVRGGASRRMAAVLQPGTQVVADWQARLDSHIGHLTIEPARSRAGLMAGRLPLALAGSALALSIVVLAEREPHPGLYAATVALLDLLAEAPDRGAAIAAYVRWEKGLLAELGFGMDLSACAATGTTQDLAFVSPRTGRAVSRSGAGDWAPRLLPLPGFLADGGSEATADDLRDGLALTGHFLRHAICPALGLADLPAARLRLTDMLDRLDRT